MDGPVAATLSLSLSSLHDDLDAILRAGIAAVAPAALLRGAHSLLLDFTSGAPVSVVAAGKAAGPMVAALAAALPGVVTAGVVTSRRPDETAASGLTWFEAGHPSPTAASAAAGEAALAIASASRERGRLLVLLSGGASAMLAVPADGVTLANKLDVARDLMRAGVAIDGLNCVRKHLSAIKGGRLGAVAGPSLTLAISDVHGPTADDPSVIGSGPTVADPTTFEDARRVIADAGIDVPPAVSERLAAGARGELEETIKPGDPRLADAQYAVIGSRGAAMAGARAAAEALGYHVFVIERALAGESRDAAAAFVDEAMARAGDVRPACVIASGETTVRVTGRGTGGRNQEFALAAAPALRRLGGDIALASAGTDGIDGPTDAAGGRVDATTLDRAAARGLDWGRAMREHDSTPFLRTLGDLIVTGPTGTNVGDVAIFLIRGRF